MKILDWYLVFNHIMAGMFSILCGLLVFFLVYNLVGFLVKPLEVMIENVITKWGGVTQ